MANKMLALKSFSRLELSFGTITSYFLTLLLHCVGREAWVADSQALTALQQLFRLEVMAPDDPDPARRHASSALQDVVTLPMDPRLDPAFWHDESALHESLTSPTFPTPRPSSSHDFSEEHEFVIFPMDPPVFAPEEQASFAVHELLRSPTVPPNLPR